MSIQPFRSSESISTSPRRWGTASGTVFLLCCFVSLVSARQVNVVIQPPVDSRARAFVEVTGVPERNWSFRNSYSGVSELGIRIERPEAFDESGAEISVRK